jgi:hypothetical protein
MFRNFDRTMEEGMTAHEVEPAVSRAALADDRSSPMGLAKATAPHDEEGVMTDGFYAPPPASARLPKERKTASEKPLHYKVICISMYTKDLERLDAMVDSLKGRGMTKANRSALIRAALEQLDLERVPRGL